ncbi:MAG: OmpA family protein [Puniceicoccales bacterium]|jgi:outer membrane protein OmpA-like peptidoglycan-associated protein|nr:OmpA family protein [Puniceicoccales bacterium]
MKRVYAVVFCFCLTGCFNRSKHFPDPQPSDTQIKQPIRPEREKFLRDDENLGERLDERCCPFERSEDKVYGQLYDEKDVALSVYFDFDNFGLSEKNQDLLCAIVEHLKQNPRLTLLIVGHCDWRGTDAYNLRLGEKRANSVERFLGDNGIAKRNVEILSLGSIHATQGLSKVDSWRDRRCDLVIYPLK